MSLTPFSRDALRALKALNDKLKLEEAIKIIYYSVLSHAETTPETVFSFNLNSTGAMFVSNKSIGYSSILNRPFQITAAYIKENMEEILAGLRRFFPDCSVEYKEVSIATGRDGKEYDISKLDDIFIPLISGRPVVTNQSVIIDWS
jgi:hypothetical protein